MDGLTFPLDREILVQRAYEASLKPGDVVLDVGAHLGRHTFPLARCIGPTGWVHAFEPVPGLRQAIEYALLTRHLDLSPRVQVYDCALGRESGDEEFVVVLDNLGYSGLKTRIYPGPVRLSRINVAVRTMDELFLELPGLAFIKIDAEGGELDILRGGSRCLTRFRPVIAFEFGTLSSASYQQTPWDMLDFLADHEYQVLRIDGQLMTPDEFARSAVDQDWCDYIAIPGENRAMLDRVQRTLISTHFDRPRLHGSLASARSLSQTIGQQPPFECFSRWIRPLARWAAGVVLALGRVLVNPQRRTLAAMLTAMDTMSQGLCAVETELLQTRKRVRELEAMIRENVTQSLD